MRSLTLPGIPNFPSLLQIEPIHRPLEGTIRPPGSKSITNRALVLGAFSSHARPVKLSGVLFSEDTDLMIKALQELGFQVEVRSDYGEVDIRAPSSAPVIPASQADLFCGNSGTTMRFLTAAVSIGCGIYRLDGVPRMRERPIEDLLGALRQLGVDALSELGTGCPPVRVKTQGWRSNASVWIRGDVSSQFISALLLAAPWSRAHVSLQILGQPVSKPYILMTLRMLEQFGAHVVLEEINGLSNHTGHSQAMIIPEQNPCGIPIYTIEPDATAATYWWAAAAITGGTVTVTGIGTDSLQGDVAFVDVLQQMGCRVEKGSSQVTVHGGELHGVEVDMNAISDTVMTLAAVACFADSPTRISNVAHIRYKETDRISALACELRRLGVEVREFEDGLEIRPRPMRGAVLETYNDHRMAMSLALIGLRVPGIVIREPACVVKTYPHFFQDLERLCAPYR
jgi:3-phosphoshikimate 1-carboxyvinyltransferase